MTMNILDKHASMSSLAAWSVITWLTDKRNGTDYLENKTTTHTSVAQVGQKQAQSVKPHSNHKLRSYI
jgi:hypothetical protein